MTQAPSATSWIGLDPSQILEQLTYREIAKTIDHSLLRPELDDQFLDDNIRLALEYDVASLTMRPADVARAVGMVARLETSRWARSWASRTATISPKPRSSRRTERSSRVPWRSTWSSRSAPSSRAATRTSRTTFARSSTPHTSGGAIVKVIFENAYLTDDEKIRACRLTEAAGGDFVKTSTGFATSGATHEDLRLMRANTSPHIQVKAAGGVRTLDALLDVMALGVTRIGATATKLILDDFRARKQGIAPADGATDASAAGHGAY